MVSINDVRNMIQDPSFNLGVLCSSPKINQWSFYKPVNASGTQSLEDRDLYDVNDGFFLFTFNNPSRMIYELQNPNASNIWSYEDRIEPYRLTDFDGYGASILDFGLSFVNSSSGNAGDTLRLQLNYDIPTFIQWKYFEGVRSYVDIVLLVYEYGTTFDAGGTTGVWICKVTSMVDYDDRINMRIPNDLSYGNYEVRLCFSTATGSMSDGEWMRFNQNSSLYGDWWALPHNSKTTFTVTSSPGPGPGPSPTDFFDYVDFDNFLECSFDYYDPYLYNVRIKQMIVLNDTHQDLNVYVNYSYENRVGGPVSWGSYSFPLNEGDLYKILTIQWDGPTATMTSALLEDDIINIKISASITNNQTGVSQTKSWNQRIEKT